MPHTKINLLPEGRAVKTRKNPILVWYSRIGVYILMVVYVVTLGGLGYRWFYDEQLADIQQRIDDKVSQVSKDLGFIANFKKLQNNYQVLGEAIDIGHKKVDYMKFVTATIPEPVKVLDLEIAEIGMHVSATTQEYGAVNQWYRAFESNEIFSMEDSFSEKLAEGKLPESLRVAFANKGYVLDPDVVVVETVNANEWTVRDYDYSFSVIKFDKNLSVRLSNPLFQSITLSNVERNVSTDGGEGLVNFAFDIKF